MTAEQWDARSVDEKHMKGKSNKIPMQLIDLEIIPLVLLPLHHL